MNTTTRKTLFNLVYQFTLSIRINPVKEALADRMLRENKLARARASGIEQAILTSNKAREIVVNAIKIFADLKRKDIQF